MRTALRWHNRTDRLYARKPPRIWPMKQIAFSDLEFIGSELEEASRVVLHLPAMSSSLDERVPAGNLAMRVRMEVG